MVLVNNLIPSICQKLEEGSALLITSTDEYLSEFPADNLKRLEFATGFTGSFGQAIIGPNLRILITDSRYTIQAKTQCPGFEIINITEDLGDKLRQKFNKLYINLSHISYQTYQKFTHLSAKANFEIMIDEENLIDTLNLDFKPLLPSEPLQMSIEICGKSTEEKIRHVCELMTTDYILITDSTAVSWLLNIRGNDIEFSCQYLAYLLLSKDGNYDLFRNPADATQKLAWCKINNFKVATDYNNTLAYLIHNFSDTFVEFKDPICKLKASKNNTELRGFEKAHLLDGIALIKLVKWAEESIEEGINENDISDKLLSIKGALQDFIKPSFASIVGFGANSAIIHYRPPIEKSRQLSDSNILLIDCGSHYRCGTTDITRCFHFGKPTERHKEIYTVILKGLIALVSLKFPKNTPANVLNSVACKPLWHFSENCPHSIGHGVGHVLNVHESPPSISASNNETLFCNMVLSVEPGLYFENNFGIRLENLVAVKGSQKLEFLEFENLTVFPFELNLTKKELLDSFELSWLERYHLNIRAKIKPYISNLELKWFENKYLPYGFFASSSKVKG